MVFSKMVWSCENSMGSGRLIEESSCVGPGELSNSDSFSAASYLKLGNIDLIEMIVHLHLALIYVRLKFGSTAT